MHVGKMIFETMILRNTIVMIPVRLGGATETGYNPGQCIVLAQIPAIANNSHGSAAKMKKGTAGDPGESQAQSPAPSLATTRGQNKRLEVLKQFRVLLRSIKRHYQWVEQRCGLSGAQLWAMAEIADAPGLKVSDLARQLGVHLSTTSNMLRRLEELSLVKRTRIGEDQRVVQLRLTAKGAKILRLAPRPLVGILQQALAELPQARLDSLHVELGEVIRLMKFKDIKARSTPLSDI